MVKSKRIQAVDNYHPKQLCFRNYLESTFLKMRVSEIRVKRIRVNQGLGLLTTGQKTNNLS